MTKCLDKHYINAVRTSIIFKIPACILVFFLYISWAAQMGILQLSLISYCLIQMLDCGRMQAKYVCWRRHSLEWFFQITGREGGWRSSGLFYPHVEAAISPHTYLHRWHMQKLVSDVTCLSCIFIFFCKYACTKHLEVKLLTN